MALGNRNASRHSGHWVLSILTPCASPIRITHPPAMHGVIACVGTGVVLHPINLKLSFCDAAAHPAQRAAHLRVAAVLWEVGCEGSSRCRFDLLASHIGMACKLTRAVATGHA